MCQKSQRRAAGFEHLRWDLLRSEAGLCILSQIGHLSDRETHFGM